MIGTSLDFSGLNDIAKDLEALTRCAGVIYGGAVWVPGETGLVCLRIKPLSTWRVR